MKKIRNIKKISIISIVIILFSAMIIKAVLALSPNNYDFNLTFSEFKRNANILCDNKAAHMLEITLEPGQRRVGEPEWTYKRDHITNYKNDWRAYFLAYAYENRIATEDYPDLYQMAWWNKETGYNPAYDPALDDDQAKRAEWIKKFEESKKYSKRADAFEAYRKNGTPTLKIKDLKRKDYQTITFTLEGPHNDEYGFGKIKNVKVYDGATNKLLKTIENAKYGDNKITGINAYSVYITVDYDRTNASALASTYTTTSCTYTYEHEHERTGWRAKRDENGNVVKDSDGNVVEESYTYYETDQHTETTTELTGQPVTVFEGKITHDTITATSKNKVKLKTNVSLQKYITKVENTDGTVTYNGESRKNKYAREDENLFSQGTYYHQGYNISKENNVTGERTEKYSKYVKIERGDYVTYKIIVYNNSNIDTKVTIRDIWNSEFGTMISAGGLKNVSTSGGKTTYESDEFNLKPYNKAGYTKEFTIKIQYDKKYTENIIANRAFIHKTRADNVYAIEKIDNMAPNEKTKYRTIDGDYVKMRQYKVSLQKIVYTVNGTNTDQNTRWESWESKANIENKPADETYNRYNRYWKHNNPVTVAKGDTVTYAVRVRNDHDTQVIITQIKDVLPEGVMLQNITNENGKTVTYNVDGKTITINEHTKLLSQNETETFYVTVTVTESNMSTRLLRNYAEILKIANKNTDKNGNHFEVPDKTPSNNNDADYIQLRDIVISGTVWNDKALDKKQDNYNGLYDEGQENKLSNIKVQLYREGKGLIAETRTDDNGNYTFDASKIDSNLVPEQCERHIKAPYTCTSEYSGNTLHGSNYWKENQYYSYYVVFNYDGITYTSTIFADVTSTNNKDSNAKEDNGVVTETRESFNNRFSKINNGSDIKYTTKNEEEFIPQSNHVYNETTMSIQSSTNLISLSNTDSLEVLLTHVNLGLRGKDVFDLALTSDVYSTKVTVNGQEGTYNYNTNKITVRKADIAVAEDTANFASEYRTSTVGDITQEVRKTDLDKEAKTANNDSIVSKYGYTGLGIEVTYKITVTNESQTDGTATQIANYYDNKYTFKKAYSSDNQELSTTAGSSGTGYNTVIITTPGNNLTQEATMDIYVVYTLNEPTKTLEDLVKGATRIPTYNMAEIYEYTTKCGEGQTEYTRGLIDKDSAPGSAQTENVRLAPTGEGSLSTVAYYFAGENLDKLKYEDDTFATPTLYYASSENRRTISGTVFEDNTEVNDEKVRTGDGIMQDDENRVGKVTVELMEKVDENTEKNVAGNVEKYKTSGNEEYIIRYRTTTNDDGTYKFSDFLPGNYVVHYNYGKIDETFLYGETGNNKNEKSYNGEDFQSTNNIGTYGAKKLDNTENYWYVYNETERVSTGTDNAIRRKEVSGNVTNFTDNEMTVLNEAREGKQPNDEAAENVANETYMYADTPKMNITVEKTNLVDNQCKQNTEFKDYDVVGMDFGIAEVPITTIDLQKHINSFRITDSARTNEIASATRQNDGTWEVTAGNILAPNPDNTSKEKSVIDVSIEDEKLQGAYLEVKYDISTKIEVEKNFNGEEGIKVTITGIADYVDNNLAYNEALGDNSKYWKVTNYESVLKEYLEKSFYKNSKGEEVKEARTGTLDPDGTIYTSIITAKEDNPLLSSTEGATVPITLEKVISAEDTTIEDIMTSNVDTYEYGNQVEITGIEYSNENTEPTGGFSFRDRVRTTDRYIILSGKQHDSAVAETITIHPPTGSNNAMLYSIIAIVSLTVLAGGTVLIKKYAIKKD